MLTGTRLPHPSDFHAIREGAVPLPIEPHLPLGIVLFGSDDQAGEGSSGGKGTCKSTCKDMVVY